MGDYKYTVSIPRTRATGGGDTTPPVESYDLGPKIRAAIACGVFTSLFACVMWSIFTLSPDSWQMWGKGMVVVVALGILVACGLGFWWSFGAAYRAWRVDDKVRKRQWQLEDKARQAQENAAEAARESLISGQDDDGSPLSLNEAQRLGLVAWAMLRRVYVDGNPHAATRDIMSKDVCTQAEWNVVNKAMKRIGLKEKKSWTNFDFQSAWALWDESVKVEKDKEGQLYVWALKPNGDWYAIERIA